MLVKALCAGGQWSRHAVLGARVSPMVAGSSPAGGDEISTRNRQTAMCGEKVRLLIALQWARP